MYSDVAYMLISANLQVAIGKKPTTGASLVTVLKMAATSALTVYARKVYFMCHRRCDDISVKFDVMAAVYVKITVFWHMTVFTEVESSIVPVQLSASILRLEG